MKEVSFSCTSYERILVERIVNRFNFPKDQRLNVMMDLVACHANGNPLDLERLAEADNFNLCHDVYGIIDHIDRDTGKLRDCFSPRFSKKECRS